MKFKVVFCMVQQCFYIDPKIALQEIFCENGKPKKLEPPKNGNSIKDNDHQSFIESAS